MNILEKLKKEGYETVPENFYRHIDDWKNWYDGYVDSFHRYRVFNGQEYYYSQRYSMGMAKKVCEDWANLLMSEKMSFTLEGEKEQDFVDSVMAANNFRVKANEMQELKAAFGTVAYVPRVMGVKVDSKTGAVKGDASNLKIDYVYGKNVLPLAWENGEVYECAFATEHVTDNARYVYIQIHTRDDNMEYVIKNRMYKCNDIQTSDGGLTEVPLSEVDAFANIPKTVHTGSKAPQFFIDKLNIVNNIDPTLPMGVAVFANAIDQLKACDIAYDSYVNEFVMGKKRIMVKVEATKDFDGNNVFDPNDVVFYIMPEDSESGQSIQEINMELRAAQHNEGIQDMLNMLSSKCGFGENHYKFNAGSIATATQIISENSTLFRTLKKHEIVLERTLKELIKCILRLGNQYMNAGLNEDVEISIDFDDSIIEDKGTEFQRDAMMLQYGILNPYEFRAKWMNEDEETAKAALPQISNQMEAEEPPVDEE